jgi:hypothetical protein
MDGLTWIHADENLAEIREIISIDEADMQTDIKSSAQLIDNTWSMTLSEKVWSEAPIREGHYIYSPGTEWGGPVTLIKHVTGKKLVTVQGPTWRGLLYQRRIYPPAGQGYRVYTNIDANDLIGSVVGQTYGPIFIFSGEESGVLVSAQFRYQSYAVGLQTVLADAGLRLAIRFDNTIPAAVLSAEPVNQLSDAIEISQDYGINFTSEIGNVELANHCLALGGGELADREVLEVYRVGDTYYTTRPASLPTDAIRTVLLDYGSAESTADLLKSAIERLQATAPKQSISINELPLNIDMQLGDQLNVRDRLTGLEALSEVTNKILTIKQGRTEIDTQISVLTIKSA